MRSEPLAPAGPYPMPGARQARWTLLQMLRPLVTDIRARRGRAAQALVLGCGDGSLSRELRELGFARVLGVDERAELLERADAERARRAIGEQQLAYVPVGSLPASVMFDLVLVESIQGDAGNEAETLAQAYARTHAAGVCAIVTGARVETRDRAREAGFDRVSLIEPPADAERSYVLRERALLTARRNATNATRPSETVDG